MRLLSIESAAGGVGGGGGLLSEARLPSLGVPIQTPKSSCSFLGACNTSDVGIVETLWGVVVGSTMVAQK